MGKHPDWVEACADSPAYGWRVLAASVKGLSHSKTGEPCQDSSRWLVLTDNTLIAAVADGAGSAGQAEVGADLATSVALKFLSDNPIQCGELSEHSAQTLLVATIERCADVLDQTARERNVPLRDFASTLTLLLATPRMVFAAQVGDGAIVVEDASGNLTSLLAPQRGEYVNETTFLVSPDYPASIQFGSMEGRSRRIALLTDGLQRLALNIPSYKPHAPFFDPLFQFVESTADEPQGRAELIQFLTSPRITERATDDLTLLLAHRI